MLTNEHKIFLIIPNGVSIELKVIDRLSIRDIIQTAREEIQSTNQVLKIFKENELLRSSVIIEQNDLRDRQVFQAQIFRKQQSFFYKRANSDLKEIIVDVEKQKIADIIQLIKREIGVPENKKIQAKLKDQILDQYRYFYEYKNIIYDPITINEEETQQDLEIPPYDNEENQQIFLQISYQNNIIQVLCSYQNTIDEVCMNIQKKVQTTETLNLYQNYKRLKKNSILANYIIVSQENLMASIDQECYDIIVKYQNLEEKFNIDPKCTLKEFQQFILEYFKIPQNFNLSFKLNNIELDIQNNLEEYFIQDQTIYVSIISKEYTFIMPNQQKKIPLQIEDINMTIYDIVEYIKEQYSYEHISFCAYEGRNRLNMRINIVQLNLQTNIITLWEDQQNTIKKDVSLSINVVDFKKLYEIQIVEDLKIKELEFYFQDLYKINENLQFYYNKKMICPDYTIKELGIVGQIEILCQIAKKQFYIQVRYNGIIKKLTVCRTWLVSQLIERSKQIYQINKDNLIVILDQTVLNNNYELNNYLIDEILDICEQGQTQFKLKVLMNNDTVWLNVLIDYQNTIQDLLNQLINKYIGRKFYVYYDKKKQQEKKLLREFDLENLLACEVKNDIKFNIQIQDQQIDGQSVDSNVVIGDYFNQLFQINNKGFKLTIQDMVLEQNQQFSYYLILETDKICIEIPDKVSQLQVDGSQLNCPLISQNIGQFQEKEQTSIELIIQISINKKLPKQYKINILWTAQQLIEFICQKEKIQLQNCKLYYKDNEIQNNTNLKSLQLKYGDLLDILYKQKHFQKQWRCRQMYQKQTKYPHSKQQLSKSPHSKEQLSKSPQSKQQLSKSPHSKEQLSKTPFSKETIKNKELKTPRKVFCICGKQPETCRRCRYRTFYS